MASPASTIDSPIASAARATNVDIGSDKECEQVLVSSRVAVKLGIISFFALSKTVNWVYGMLSYVTSNMMVVLMRKRFLFRN